MAGMSEASETAPVLRHLELPPGPGTRVTLYLPAGNEMLESLICGSGFTLVFDGDRWRSEVQSLSGDRAGVTVGLEITGRYPEDAPAQVSSSPARSSPG